ncbi:peptide-methionine (R)-S-oxide reductase MsrB [Idiomarina sp.]|uniref:peptide-methionine (R)-S-oxide reductase MsrB n=1 Tax=Idiomarina sp. TaxID=1874361 RepID=UPI00258CB8F7|nr:peptide-methionine (R)-S-oxide reductase MsrB [Idiomarina sp.]
MSNQQNDTNWNDLSDEQWRERLTPEQYQILRKQGTEAPFSGDFIQVNEHGEYHCAGCGQLLFTGQQQFEGHCGWPSFDEAIDGAIEYREDSSHGMQRIEIVCSRCKGHLGHVFNDGPTETGQRYCVNSLALTNRGED